MKSKKVAAFLAFFFGMIGVHRFYLGQRFRGILYFAASVFGMVITVEEGVPLIIIPALVVMIDVILFIAMPREDFDARYNSKQQRYIPDYQRRDRHYRVPAEPQQFAAVERAPARQTKKAVNPFKKNGIEKYKDYDYEGAIADFQKALRFKYEDPAVHFNLACCYSIKEDLDQSLFHLDKAMEYGFVQLDRIHDHPALAYIRTYDQFEIFVKQGYRIVDQAPASINTLAQLPSTNTTEEVLEETESVALPDLLEQISRLGELKEKGVLTDEEFEVQKQKILNLKES